MRVNIVISEPIVEQRPSREERLNVVVDVFAVVVPLSLGYVDPSALSGTAIYLEQPVTGRDGRERVTNQIDVPPNSALAIVFRSSQATPTMLLYYFGATPPPAFAAGTLHIFSQPPATTSGNWRGTVRGMAVHWSNSENMLWGPRMLPGIRDPRDRNSFAVHFVETVQAAIRTFNEAERSLMRFDDVVIYNPELDEFVLMQIPVEATMQLVDGWYEVEYDAELIAPPEPEPRRGISPWLIAGLAAAAFVAVSSSS